MRARLSVAALAASIALVATATGVRAGAASTTSRPKLAQLEQAIAASVAIKKAPDLNTSIPPLQSLTGLDGTIKNMRWPCYTQSETSVPANAATSCVWGDTKAHRTIFIFGDSQSAMWLAGINPIAIEQHWRIVFVAHTGCPPWPDQATTNRQGQNESNCLAWVRSELALEARVKPAVVIPVGLGIFLGTGKQLTVPALERAQVKLVHLVAPAKVVFLSPIPMYESWFTHYTPETCLVVSPDDLQKCEYAPSAMVNADEAAAGKATAKATKMPYVDVTRLFCTNVRCALFVKDGGNRLVYVDSEHANRFYMDWISTALSALLTPDL